MRGKHSEDIIIYIYNSNSVCVSLDSMALSSKLNSGSLWKKSLEQKEKQNQLRARIIIHGGSLISPPTSLKLARCSPDHLRPLRRFQKQSWKACILTVCGVEVLRVESGDCDENAFVFCDKSIGSLQTQSHKLSEVWSKVPAVVSCFSCNIWLETSVLKSLPIFMFQRFIYNL